MKNYKGFLIVVYAVVLTLTACNSVQRSFRVPEGWKTGVPPAPESGLTWISNLQVFSINTPVAGNYPQSLYNYPFRAEHDAWFLVEDFTQTIEWHPPVEKVFEKNTSYVVVIKIDPVNTDTETRTLRGVSQSSVSGLPSEGVKRISAELVRESLYIYITFEETGDTYAEPIILFGDEFEGTELDMTKWDLSPSPVPMPGAPQPWNWIRHGRSSWNTNGEAAGVSDLVEVKDGCLYLHFFKDTIAGEKYASVEPWGSQGQQFWWTGDDVQLTREYLVNNWVSAGAIRSMGTDYTRRMFEHGYGWYEARIKFPKVAGTMGAFWLMSNTFNREGNKGQYGTEIDILESIGNAQGTWDFALHWGIPGSHESYFRDFKQPNKLNNGQNLDIYDGEFHVFALDWSPSGYVFYINNIEMGKIPNDGGNRVNNLQVNRNPNYIKFSMESAFWDAPLPDDFTSGSIVIDYIRVYNQPQIR